LLQPKDGDNIKIGNLVFCLATSLEVILTFSFFLVEPAAKPTTPQRNSGEKDASILA